MTTAPDSNFGLSTPRFLPAPAPMRVAGAVVSVLAMLAAGASALFAVQSRPEPLWAVAGLQVLVVLGGVFGLLWSRGKFATGPVLGMLCAAGSVLVGGMLSFVAHRGVLGALDMKVWAGLEVLAAVVMAVLALWSAIERDRESRSPAVKGVFLAMPSLVLLVVVGFGDRIGVTGALASLPMWARLGGFVIAGAVAAVMLCMAAHHWSEAFGRATRAGRAA